MHDMGCKKRVSYTWVRRVGVGELDMGEKDGSGRVRHG